MLLNMFRSNKLLLFFYFKYHVPLIKPFHLIVEKLKKNLQLHMRNNIKIDFLRGPTIALSDLRKMCQFGHFGRAEYVFDN